MGFTGSYNICGLSGDKGTVGVGNETSVVGIVGNSNGSGQGKTVSGKVSGFSGGYIGSINRDDGTVGVGNQTAEVAIVVARISSIAEVVGVSSVPGTGIVSVVESWGISVSTFGGKVSSFSSLDLRGLGGSHSTL